MNRRATSIALALGSLCALIFLPAVFLPAVFLPTAFADSTPPASPAPVSAAPISAAPPSVTGRVVETLHGIEIADPYRWLEGSDAPEIEAPDPTLDARVERWTAAQNDRTRSLLDDLPGRERLAERLTELYGGGTIEAPTVRGERLFYRERRGDQAQEVLFVRRGEGEPRVLIDPGELDPSGLTTLAWYVPSPDGELLAFGLFRGGDENATAHVMETESGAWLADEIPGKVQPVLWMPDGEGFFYRRLADLDNPYSARIQFHPLGRHHRQDPLIFAQYEEGPLATTYGPYPFLDPGGRWLGVIYFTGSSTTDLWVYDLTGWTPGEKLERREVIMGKEAENLGLLAGDTLFLQTTLDAPNGRILALDLGAAEASWREIVAERERAVVQGVTRAGNHLVVSFLDHAATRLELFTLAGEPRGEIELPGLGTARVGAEHDRDEIFIAFESFNTPDTIYRVALPGGERALWKRLDLPVDPSRITVEQVFYASKDGTLVPMFLVYRRDLRPDGERPTILDGYGGFNVSRTPRFSARVIPWVEAGGVYALANLRGGGEYGERWHEAGMLEHKQNVFDDFIAAAEWLTTSGWTSPEHLGVWGGSNGGLLTGAVLVQRPHLFSAVISAVPLLDMLRYHHFLMARYWIPEYGSAEDPEQFEYLLEYSPYHRVEDGVEYPAVLLTAGKNDARVHPLHARKMAARLQEATASDPTREPVLLWIEGEAGHGRGKPVEIRRRESADVLSFMAWQLGLEVGAGAAGARETAAAPAAGKP